MMKRLMFLVTFVWLSFMAYTQNHSVLSQGNWVEIYTEKAGVYRLTYHDLKDMGVEVDNLSSEKINLYGIPAGALTENYSPDFVYDLQKMAILVDDSGDGTFDAGDFLLFYGESPVTWNFNNTDESFQHQLNPYCNKVFYFLRTDDTSEAKRIKITNYTNLTPTDTITNLTYTYLHEKELYNPLHGGQQWMGEMFKDTIKRIYKINLSGYNITDGEMFLSFASNSSELGLFKVYVNSQLVDTIKTFITNYKGIEAYKIQSDKIKLPEINDQLNIEFVFDKPNDSAFAYLDYFELNLKTNLQIANPEETSFIRRTQTQDEGIFYYHFTNTQRYNYIWDITDPLNITQLKTKTETNSLSFIDTHSNRDYLMFNYAPKFKFKSKKNPLYKTIVGFINLPTPGLVGMINNQDVIGTNPSNIIIITNNEIEEAANRLANFHRENDDLTTEVYKVNDIYNEFSAGRADPTAIRNFIAFKAKQDKRGNQLKYVIMFGPANFDYRGILFSDTNQVPTYISAMSDSKLKTYHSDMYYTHLGENQGGYIASVGRIPATTLEEANRVIDKIEHYYASLPNKSWKNNTSLIADDNDYGVHINDQELISQTILENNFNINQTKLYLSLFENNEQGYSNVKKLLLNQLSNGTFFVCFSGHSCPTKLTQENIFSTNDAKQLKNLDVLPVWASGGSSTARFNDPDVKSIGMEMLLNNEGGAIIFIGNSGLAFANANISQLKSFNNYFFDPENHDKTIGETYLESYKTLNHNSTNHWTLIGDPAINPVWPDYQVKTSIINNKPAEEFNDTVAPGSSLILKGEIIDPDNNTVSSFTGEIIVTIFDMPYIKQTIESEFDPVTDITLYDSILTQSTFTVTNGEFEGTLTLPAKYHESFGNIKVSYYAISTDHDASGNWDKIVYGGDPNGIDTNPVLANLKFYPIPFTQNINLYIPEQLENGALQLSMLDVTGKQVYSNRIDNFSTSSIMTIKLPELPKGVYFMNTTTQKESRVFKLIKK